MARLRWCALMTVGGLFIVWELINAMSAYAPSRWDLVAIFIIIPMYAVGAWLTWRLPTHPQAVRLLVCGTAIVVGWPAGSVEWWPWSPVLGALIIEAAAVALLAMTLLIGSFPDGFVERRWQRLALRCSLVILLGAPLALLASPVLPVSSDRLCDPTRTRSAGSPGWRSRPPGSHSTAGGSYWSVCWSCVPALSRPMPRAGLSCESSSLSFSGCCSFSQVWWRRHLAHPKTRLWS